MPGHFDHSTSSAWHPDGRIFATGSDDRTCRIWDNRYLKKSAEVLKGKMEAIYIVAFSSDGKFMTIGEMRDFVHIYDAPLFEKQQVVDLFGDISGVSFSPDT